MSFENEPQYVAIITILINVSSIIKIENVRKGLVMYEK